MSNFKVFWIVITQQVLILYKSPNSMRTKNSIANLLTEMGQKHMKNTR